MYFSVEVCTPWGETRGQTGRSPVSQKLRNKRKAVLPGVGCGLFRSWLAHLYAFCKGGDDDAGGTVPLF
jgi:hypothetical protein